MRALVVVLWALLGCGSAAPSGDPVELATGVYQGSPSLRDPCAAVIYNAGVLVADPEYGTAAEDEFGIRPLIWPLGYTAIRLAGGEVVVLNRTGDVVATTGQKYVFTGAPWSEGRTGVFYPGDGCVEPWQE